MPSNNTVTVTAKTGPGQSVTAQAITDVSSITFDFAKGTFSVFTALRRQDFEFTDVATVTFTIAAAGGPVVVTVST